VESRTSRLNAKIESGETGGRKELGPQSESTLNEIPTGRGQLSRAIKALPRRQATRPGDNFHCHQSFAAAASNTCTVAIGGIMRRLAFILLALLGSAAPPGYPLTRA